MYEGRSESEKAWGIATSQKGAYLEIANLMGAASGNEDGLPVVLLKRPRLNA